MTDPVDRLLCTHAVRLNRNANAAGEGLEELRQAGLDDRAILDLTEIVAYFNYVNRIASGLRVEVEADK